MHAVIQACMYMYTVHVCLPIELVGYSLVQQGNPGALNPDSIIYYVHDIVLDYLKDTIPKEKQVTNNIYSNVIHIGLSIIVVYVMQVEYHKLVVDRYTTKCSRAYASLENDSYVYQKLPYHIAASGTCTCTYLFVVEFGLILAMDIVSVIVIALVPEIYGTKSKSVV